MDLALVEKLLQLMRSYGLQELEILEGETKIRLVQPTVAALPLPQTLPLAYPASYSPGPQFASSTGTAGPQSSPSQAEASSKPKLFEVRSPFVGTYYGASSPGAEDFVQVGKRVKKGQTLCIIEAMKLMNEIEAEREGVIVEILVRNEEPVEYDQVLFRFE